MTSYAEDDLPQGGVARRCHGRLPTGASPIRCGGGAERHLRGMKVALPSSLSSCLGVHPPAAAQPIRRL